MKVNDTCTGCGECLPYCTQGAIFMNAEELAAVNPELCVECGVCIDTDICPVSAFEEDPDEIAEFKKPFGRLLSKSSSAKYDVKTNDATGNIPSDKVVLRLELNRPKGGLKYGDVERLRIEMERLGWNPEVKSRSRSSIDPAFAPKAAEQLILTCHLELVLDPENIPEVVNAAVGFVTERDIWVSINVAGLAETIDHTQTVLTTAGIEIEPVAKVNLGLGRRL